IGDTSRFYPNIALFRIPEVFLCLFSTFSGGTAGGDSQTACREAQKTQKIRGPYDCRSADSGI
ncbi:hypothetical protein, partial [Enterocloster bolteae]|uniref:hypothetical protein n=1 Tax=Enterocloster bolteae TaxID=208479 RepID=UPI0027B932E8